MDLVAGAVGGGGAGLGGARRCPGGTTLSPRPVSQSPRTIPRHPRGVCIVEQSRLPATLQERATGSGKTAV